MIDPFQFLLHCNRLAKRKPDQADLLKEILSEDTDALAFIALDVARAEGDPIGLVLESVLREAPNPILCMTLANAIPDHTVALRELSLEVLQQDLSLLATLFDKDEAFRSLRDVFVGVRHFELTSNLSLTFFGSRPDLGEDAVGPATSLGKRLVVARCFLRVGIRYQSLGNVAAGIDALRRAEKVTRLVYEAEALNYLGFYSDILNALAAVLFDAGELGEAQNLAIQVGRINTESEQSASSDCQASVAEAGYLLSKILSQTNELPNALHFAECALKDFARLYEAAPPQFERWMALASANYTTVLRKGGYLEKSAAIAQELIEVLRNLVTCSADAFIPDYASTLIIYSENLMISGKISDSITAAADSVRLYRDLCSVRPFVFGTKLCSSLIQLAAAIVITEGNEPSLAHLNEAIELTERFSADSAEARYWRACATLQRSFVNLHAQSWEKAHDDAMVAFDELSACEKIYPLSDTKMAASALLMRIEALECLARYGEALELFGNLTVLNGTLTWHFPDEHTLHLSRSFEVKAKVHIGLSQFEDASYCAFHALTRCLMWSGDKSFFFTGQHASSARTFSRAAYYQGNRDLWKEHEDTANQLYRDLESKGLRMIPPPPMLTQAR